MQQDIRTAIRSLRSAPGYTLVALLVLTLGVGAGTAIFSVVDTVVLRGLPFDEADRLVSVSVRNTRTGSLRRSNAPQDFLDWSAQQDVFSAFAAWSWTGGFQVQVGEHPVELRTQQVSADFFEALRSPPRLGRGFTPEDEVEGSNHVLILSDGLWRNRLGADQDIIGRSIDFKSGPWTIIGVMPRSFTFPLADADPAEMWVPYVVPENLRQRGKGRNYSLRLIGRLQDGVSIEQAQTRMQAITAGLAEKYPDWFTDQEANLRPLYEALVGSVRPWMMMLLGAVGFVMLIACVNVANLMLARATVRNREIQIRAALGAGRWQIARSLLVESLVLFTVGTACALLAARWGVAALKSALPEDLPRIAAVGIDLRILAVAALAALVTGLLFGLAPALQFSRPDLAGALSEGVRGTAGNLRQWLRSGLVVAEVALAVVLLVGAGLFVLSFVRLVNVDLGLDYENVLVAEVYPPFRGFGQEHAERAATVVAEVMERVRPMPGVEEVGFISGGVPLGGSWVRYEVGVPGREEEFGGDDMIDLRQVNSGYARAIRTRLLSGRYIEETDTKASQPVIVLNQEAARRYLQGRDPIGAVVKINGERTVVGVVENVRLAGPESEVRPEGYVPWTQFSVYGGELVIRTRTEPLAIAEEVREAVWASLPEITRPGAVTMKSMLGKLIAQRELNMMLVSLFGVLAIVIAAAGIYGVMAYIVTQRTREIGVRMALGAQPGRVLRMVLGRASLFMMLGLAAGLAGAWMLAFSVESFLFQVEPREMTVYASAAAILFLCGLLAAFLPARRAARVDPIVALRTE